MENCTLIGASGDSKQDASPERHLCQLIVNMNKHQLTYVGIDLKAEFHGQRFNKSLNWPQ